MTYSVTQDFRAEYEAERTRWLRRRTLLYTALVAGFGAVELSFLLLGWASGFISDLTANYALLAVFIRVPQTIVYALTFLFVWKRSLGQQALLRIVLLIIVISGSIAVIARPIIGMAGEAAAADGLSSYWALRFTGLNDVFVLHFVACLFIPFTPREAVRPLVPLLSVLALVTLVTTGAPWGQRIGFILLTPLVGLPGVLVCWWRHSRFRSRFHYRMFRSRYGELQRDLIDARSVHEELFPTPLREGPVRFHYRYEPMRQIGGDYLYAFVDLATDLERPTLSIVLIDVTGHGIKAALTINRIYGELERVHAETPGIPPGELMLALNRYVRLTLAKHSIYATALCMRIDPADDSLAYCSGGHPPAFLRDAAGRIERLDSTAPLLGVIPKPAYDPGELKIRFAPGDTLIAYTDGATDAINDQGKRMQIDGIMRILASDRAAQIDHGRWTETISREIERFRTGAAVDDTLLVEIWRPIAPADPPTTATRRGDRAAGSAPSAAAVPSG